VSLGAKDVAEILKLLDESVFEELTLETNGLKIHLRRGDAGPRVHKANGAEVSPMKTAAPLPAERPEIAPPPEGMCDVPSPLLGVFYRAPKPGEPPFVEIGQRIEEDTIIGIIEVMKLMNSVRAGVRGELVEIFAKNGALVEFDEPLVRVRG
jgi:acetyl-CoA carboxylase biotin carboxyl carrier protein